VLVSPINVQVGAYEGPLDLLLDLIRKQEINIYDIPIATITQQYLEYMQHAVELNVELSSEFVYMAATLILIKSKMLLPRDPELEKEPSDDDPRKELVDRLVEHERFKQAAEMLQQKRVIEEATWSNPQMQQFESQEDTQPGLSVSLFDLVKVFQNVLDRVKSKPVYEVGKEDISVPDMIRYIGDLFKNDREGVASATRIFENQPSRRAMICLFLAVLELVKSQAIMLTQSEMFGDIGIKAADGFDAAFASRAAISAIDQEYN
jgi:segregation and condensation protein A